MMDCVEPGHENMPNGVGGRGRGLDSIMNLASEDYYLFIYRMAKISKARDRKPKLVVISRPVNRAGKRKRKSSSNKTSQQSHNSSSSTTQPPLNNRVKTQ
uniref:Uncharacterized protein n=1 Tax=Cacopsylla melanoneura TaxID=428564 RepID=A0A8D8S518_9HEMI